MARHARIHLDRAMSGKLPAASEEASDLPGNEQAGRSASGKSDAHLYADDGGPYIRA
jgi:hypothetical protein